MSISVDCDITRKRVRRIGGCDLENINVMDYV